MKKYLIFLLVPFMMILSSCESLPSEEIFQDEVALKSAGIDMNFQAHLSGDQEVPEADTKATGQAIFKLSKDGMTLSYKLIVANIEDVRMAHIHLAPTGQNGGVVVWLYPSSPPPAPIPGKTNGILAQGEITGDNLVGALAGKTLDSLLENINSGNAYVNVHTDAYPGGEIRGQIK